MKLMMMMMMMLCWCVWLVAPVISRDGVDTSPTTIINDTALLNCAVSGIPRPEVMWLRDGRLLDTTLHPNIQLVASGRQLRIDNAAVTDAAVYRCLATNKAGQDRLDYQLSVHSQSIVTCCQLYHIDFIVILFIYLTYYTSLVITLRSKLSGAVYCYRSCLWWAACLWVCVCVCGSVTTITRNCVIRSPQNWVCRCR